MNRFSPFPFGRVHFDARYVQLILEGVYPILLDPRPFLTKGFFDQHQNDLLLVGMLAGSPNINQIQTDFGDILSKVSLAFYKEHEIPLGIIKKGQRRMNAINIADPPGVLDILQKSSAVNSSELARNLIGMIVEYEQG